MNLSISLAKRRIPTHQESIGCRILSGKTAQSPYYTGNEVCVGYLLRMKSTHKKRNVQCGGFALGDAKILRHLMQEIPTCWYFLRKLTQKYYLLR